MTEPVLYVDVSEIRDGKLKELLVAMNELAEFVENREPQLISYAFFLDDERTHMTVVAVHPDTASLELHMDIGAREFRKFADLISLERIDVYGQVSESASRRLHQKAEMLGRGTVSIHEVCAGFTRSRHFPAQIARSGTDD